jgi:hypothetical protein
MIDIKVWIVVTTEEESKIALKRLDAWLKQ